MPTRQRLDIIYALYKSLAEIRYNDANKWDRISLGHKTASYFPGGAGAVGSFADTLNKIFPMKDDGIFFMPGDIRHSKKISHIYAAILQKYKDSGWETTP